MLSTAPSETELAARLRVAVTRLARRLRQQTEGGVSPSQLSALSTLFREGPLTLGELAASERVQRPTMTRIAAGLEELGLAARQTDPADRRVARLSLTVDGRKFLERSRTRKNAYLAQRLRRLPPDDLAVLERAADILERVVHEG